MLLCSPTSVRWCQPPLFTRHVNGAGSGWRVVSTSPSPSPFRKALPVHILIPIPTWGVKLSTSLSPPNPRPEVMYNLRAATQGSSEQEANWVDLFSTRHWKADIVYKEHKKLLAQKIIIEKIKEEQELQLQAEGYGCKIKSYLKKPLMQKNLLDVIMSHQENHSPAQADQDGSSDDQDGSSDDQDGSSYQDKPSEALDAKATSRASTLDHDDEFPPGSITRARAKHLHMELKKGLTSLGAPSLHVPPEPVILIMARSGA